MAQAVSGVHVESDAEDAEQGEQDRGEAEAPLYQDLRAGDGRQDGEARRVGADAEERRRRRQPGPEPCAPSLQAAFRGPECRQHHAEQEGFVDRFDGLVVGGVMVEGTDQEGRIQEQHPTQAIVVRRAPVQQHAEP
jgi:hypothetical protein